MTPCCEIRIRKIKSKSLKRNLVFFQDRRRRSRHVIDHFRAEEEDWTDLLPQGAARPRLGAKDCVSQGEYDAYTEVTRRAIRDAEAVGCVRTLRCAEVRAGESRVADAGWIHAVEFIGPAGVFVSCDQQEKVVSTALRATRKKCGRYEARTPVSWTAPKRWAYARFIQRFLCVRRRTVDALEQGVAGIRHPHSRFWRLEKEPKYPKGSPLEYGRYDHRRWDQDILGKCKWLRDRLEDAT